MMADMVEQEDVAFGFWLFLLSDAIIFALLFATYAVLVRGTAGGPDGAMLFSLPRAFAETVLLLLSSATFGVASVLARGGEARAAMLLLFVTMLLGLGFLSLEASELLGLAAGGNGPDRSGFLSAFFTLTGAHGAHVAVGVLWIAVMLGQIAAKGLTAPVCSRLFRLGLYWHFLDIIWVGIFSVVYLASRL